jgi:hypothetical protein
MSIELLSIKGCSRRTDHQISPGLVEKYRDVKNESKSQGLLQAQIFKKKYIYIYLCSK